MRQYPDRPIVSVGAVVVDGDRVLLVKRAHEPLQGHWSLPGGVVELGETLHEQDAIVIEDNGTDPNDRSLGIHPQILTSSNPYILKFP